MKAKKTGDTIIYALLVGAILLAGFVLYGAFVKDQNASAPVIRQPGAASGCGDLTDSANVQHLSHHPSQYAECIKQVGPAKFKEAVGVDKATFMEQNGIK